MQDDVYKLRSPGPGWVGQLVEASSSTLKGFGFDPGSGHKPRLRV